MNRFTLATVLAALVLTVSPAQAQTVTGTILLPDFGSPSIGRTLYTAGINGTLGYVFQLSGNKSTFSLVKTRTTTGLESFDIFFYTDGGGQPGTSLQPAYNTCPGIEPYCNKSGPIPAGARWAVVSLVLGVDASFRYSAT